MHVDTIPKTKNQFFAYLSHSCNSKSNLDSCKSRIIVGIFNQHLIQHNTINSALLTFLKELNNIFARIAKNYSCYLCWVITANKEWRISNMHTYSRNLTYWTQDNSINRFWVFSFALLRKYAVNEAMCFIFSMVEYMFKSYFHFSA